MTANESAYSTATSRQIESEIHSARMRSRIPQKVKFTNMRNHIMKIAILSLAFMVASMAQGYSQISAGEGLYIVVNFVPQECKAKVDGFYLVSKERKISFSFMDVQIAVDRDIEVVRQDLRKAIQHYCRQKFPSRNAFPDIYIIPAADVKKAGNGVLVIGQARKPGLIPMKDGLTVHEAVQIAGGVTEFSTMRHVVILRGKETIDCDLTEAESRKVLLKSGDLVNVPRKCFVAESEYSFHYNQTKQRESVK